MKELSETQWKQMLSEAAFLSGTLAYAQGDTVKAIECFKYALELDPDNKNATNALTQILG